MSDDNLTIFVVADAWHMATLGGAFAAGVFVALAVTLAVTDLLTKVWSAAVVWRLSRRIGR